jgi:hypothetical protein
MTKSLNMIGYPDSDSFIQDSDFFVRHLEFLQARADRVSAEQSVSKRLSAELEQLNVELKQQLEQEKAKRTEADFLLFQSKERVSELEALVAERDKALEERDKTIDEMRIKLGDPAANPENSGLSPSKGFGGKSKSRKAKAGDTKDGDGKDPEKKEAPVKGKPGAKKGHEGHSRKPFQRDQIDEFLEYEPESTTCDCGGETEPCEEHDIVNHQFELPAKPHRKIEHRAKARRCRKCGRIHRGKLPEHARGLLSSGLIAVIVSLKLNCNASFRGIQKHLWEVYGIDLCLGVIVKYYNNNCECVAKAYEEIKAEIPKQPVLNIDETTHKENGRRLYTWIFVGIGLVLYVIGDRSKTIINNLLTTKWTGVVVSDDYCVYHNFSRDGPGVTLQTCLQHLMRAFKRCAEHTLDVEISAYGQKMLDLARKLLKARDEFEANANPETHATLKGLADEFNREGANAPSKGRAATLAKRFKGEASFYTTFVDSPGVPATNNMAERILRDIVMARHVTQGTRGEAGRRASEIYWSVRSTCRLQKRSFYQFFLDSLLAYRENEPGPSILPQKS